MSGIEELKYRVWDKTSKEMTYFTLLDLCCCNYYLLSEPKGELKEQHLKDVEIMQYIGLRDSKNTEEYFVDVIEESNGARGVIKDGRSAILYQDIKSNNIKYFWGLLSHRVIGNTHENPELMEIENEQH